MKINRHKIFGQLLLLLLASGIIALIIGAMRQSDHGMCSSVNIVINDGLSRGFISEQEIRETVTTILKARPEGTDLPQFDLRAMELALESNIWISSAQLFFDKKNTLSITVFLRNPIARIIDRGGASYYIDSNFLKLPLSNSGRADLPVITGVPVNLRADSRVARGIVAFAKQINADSFWLAQVAQIDVVNNGFVLYPAVGNCVVDLGDGEMAANKLQRLKIFYKTASAQIGFEVWKKISVAFKGQLIATQKDSSANGNAEMQVKPLQPDKENNARANKHSNAGMNRGDGSAAAFNISIYKPISSSGDALPAAHPPHLRLIVKTQANT